MEQKKVIDISWQTILKIIFVIFLLYFFYLIRSILVLLVFALTISILLEPAIHFFSKKIKRVWAVGFVYLVLVGILVLFCWLIFPLVFEQMKEFSLAVPGYLNSFSFFLQKFKIPFYKGIEDFINFDSEGLVKFSKNIWQVFLSTINVLFSLFTVLILAFFISLEEKTIEKAIVGFFPERYGNYILGLWQNYQRSVASWFGVRILACFFVGFFTFLFLYLIKIKYSLLFGILYGVLEIIPVLGPLLGAILIIFFVGLESFEKAIWTVIFLFLLQQLENILTPVLVKRFIAIPSLLVFLCVLIGGKIFGVLGAVLAIPLGVIFFSIIKDYIRKIAF